MFLRALIVGLGLITLFFCKTNQKIERAPYQVKGISAYDPYHPIYPYDNPIYPYDNPIYPYDNPIYPYDNPIYPYDAD